MNLADYKAPPKGLFLFRMLGPAIFAFLVGYVVMGFVSLSSEIRDNYRANAAYIPSLGAGPDSVMGSASHQFKQITYRLSNIPDVCFPGRAVNDFQRSQCNTFWNHTVIDTLLGAIPFVVVLVSLLIAYDLFLGLHRKSLRLLERGKADLSGIVTNPPEAPNDIFGWWYGFRSIAVQLPSKAQIRVYMPLAAPVPLPAQTLALFNVGNQLGTPRYVALLYAPHMAVIDGSK
jgi:hypothetical protein